MSSFYKFRGECTFSLGARNWPVVLLRYEQRWFTHCKQPTSHSNRCAIRHVATFIQFFKITAIVPIPVSRFVASARGFEGSSPSALIRLPFYCCMPHSRPGAAAFNAPSACLLGELCGSQHTRIVLVRRSQGKWERGNSEECCPEVRVCEQLLELVPAGRCPNQR